MKTRILLSIIGAAALAAITLNANASDTRLTPRATGNQSKHVSAVSNNPNPVNPTGLVIVAPRAAGNQAVTVTGISTEVTPAMACARIMTGSPKTIQACVEHPATMPGCNSTAVASLK